ncbi:WD repeat protein Lub1 [Naganishia albida]|nr:WD repeat protein Lub1 [Naganishia albida]
MSSAAAGEDTYQLSTVLRAHSDDVKCVYPIDADRLLSASRDRTVGVWRRKGASKDFELQTILSGHDGYVNSLEFIPPDEECQFGIIASAGNSTIILLHLFDDDPAAPPPSEPVDGLIGHHANICALFYSRKHRQLISASWDCAARVWSRTGKQGKPGEEEKGRVKSKAGEWECRLVLSGHMAAVWGVAILEGGPHDGFFLSGSADKTLKMYDTKGVPIRTFDAPEAIRSISPFLDFRRIAMALNDSTIRILNMEDGSSETLPHHSDYVYHVAVDDANDVISCGEDQIVAYWNPTQKHLQKLIHPCQSVWCCAFMENGDIVSAGSDDAIRIWSTREERQAEADVLAEYEKEVGRARSQKESGADSESEDVVLDVVLDDEQAPLQLRFDKNSDPVEVAAKFGEEHRLKEDEVARLVSFLNDLHLK